MNLFKRCEFKFHFHHDIVLAFIAKFFSATLIDSAKIFLWKTFSAFSPKFNFHSYDKIFSSFAITKIFENECLSILQHPSFVNKSFVFRSHSQHSKINWFFLSLCIMEIKTRFSSIKNDRAWEILQTFPHHLFRLKPSHRLSLCTSSLLLAMSW